MVDLESFSKFNNITYDEVIEIEKLCKFMNVTEAISKFIELNSTDFNVDDFASNGDGSENWWAILSDKSILKYD